MKKIERDLSKELRNLADFFQDPHTTNDKHL